MVALQHTIGVLLLVYSVAVALPQERQSLKKRNSHNSKDAELTIDVSKNSGKNIPVKLGRAIYPSAWSTEDTESSEEKAQDNGLTDVGNKEKNHWFLSNILQSALDFVNKLRENLSFPLIRKNENKNAPKAINEDKSESIYLQFKKWLKENKILNEDDSISKYLLEYGSNFKDNNRKGYQINHRNKSYENLKPFENKNYDKSNGMIKSKLINIENDHPQTLKRNNQSVSEMEAFNLRSKELITYDKKHGYDTFHEKKHNLFESFDKVGHKNDFINKNEKIERKQNIFTQLVKVDNTSNKIARKHDNTHNKIARKSNPKLVEQYKNKHKIFTKHPIIKSLNEKSTEHVLKTKNVKAENATNNANQLNQYAHQNRTEHSRIAKNNSKRIPKFKLQTLNPRHKTFPKNSKVKENTSMGASSFPTRNKSFPKENPNELLIIETESGKRMAKSSSLTKPAIKTISKENSKMSQSIKKVSEVEMPKNISFPEMADKSISKETVADFAVAKNLSKVTTSSRVSPQQLHKENILKKSLNYSNAIENYSPSSKPKNGFSSTDAGEYLTTEKQSNFKNLKIVPSITMSEIVSVSEIQGVKTQNSNDSEITKKVLQPAILVSTSKKTKAENIRKKNQNDSQENIMPIISHSSNSLNTSTLLENSKNSQIIEKVEQPQPVDDSQVLERAKTNKFPKVNLPQLQEENILKKNSNFLQRKGSIISESLHISESNIETGSNSKEIANNRKLNEQVSSKAVSSPQSTEENILHENLEAENNLTKTDETVFENSMDHKILEAENVGKKTKLEASTKHKESDIKLNESHNTDKSTSLLNENIDSEIESSSSEESVLNSYSNSGESVSQNDENKSTTRLSDSENIYESTTLKRESSGEYSEELKDKFEYITNASHTASFDEEVSNNAIEDQESDNADEQGKFDTLLEYIYKHSNSSLFRSLGKESKSKSL